MAFTVTGRGTGSTAAGGTGLSTTPTSTIVAGSYALLVVAYDNAGGGGADPFASISDSAGNTWTTLQAALYDPGNASAGITLRIFGCQVTQDIVATSTSIAVSFGASTVASRAHALFEITTDVSGAIISKVAGAANAGSATASPTVTTSSITSGNLVIGAGASESASTWAGDGDSSNGSWSAQVALAGGSGTSGAALTVQYKQVTGTATQTYNPTLTSADVILAWVELTELVVGSFDPFGTMGFFGM